MPNHVCQTLDELDHSKKIVLTDLFPLFYPCSIKCLGSWWLNCAFGGSSLFLVKWNSLGKIMGLIHILKYFSILWMVMSSSNSFAEILTSDVVVSGYRAFGGGLGRESRTFMNGISALQEETGELSSSPLRSVPCEDTVKNIDLCSSGRELSPDPESASTLILDSPTFRTERNKCWSHLICGIHHSSPRWLRNTSF